VVRGDVHALTLPRRRGQVQHGQQGVTVLPSLCRTLSRDVDNGPTNPSVVAATCNGRTITFRRWNADFRQNMLADRSGFIWHRINFVHRG
jgi:hypothetical protein